MSMYRGYKSPKGTGRVVAMWTAMALTLSVLPTANAQVRSLLDRVASPILDPLLTQPPELNAGVLLPGDSTALLCPENSNDAFVVAIPLSLINVVDIALCNNPQVKSAWASIKVQTAAVGEARAAYLPTLTMGFSRTSNQTSTTELKFSSTLDQLNNSQFTTLNWRLLDFGGRDANRRSANALLEAALGSRDAILQKTLLSVIGSYFDAQTARAMQETKQEAELQERKTLATAQRREAKGAGAQTDTLQAITSLAKASLVRISAQGAYKKAHAVLIYTLGLPANTNLLMLEMPQEPTYGVQQELMEWLAQTQAEHPALMAARAQVVAMQQKLLVARSEGLPTLDFSASVYRNGRPTQSSAATGTQERPIRVTLNIPLFDGFARTYKIRAAEAQIEQKQNELLDIQNQILMDVVKGHADACAALESLEAALQLKAAAQDSLASVQRKYERGAADILEMLSTQSALLNAQMERIRSLADWQSAKLSLLASAGRLGRQAMTPL